MKTPRRWLELELTLSHVGGAMNLGFAACVPVFVSSCRYGFSGAGCCGSRAGPDPKHCGVSCQNVVFRVDLDIVVTGDDRRQSKCYRNLWPSVHMEPVDFDNSDIAGLSNLVGFGHAAPMDWAET